MLRKLKTFFVYVWLFHFVRLICEICIPNAHFGNRVRGYLFGFFFDSVGSRFAVASGVVINCPWRISVGDDVYIAHRCWINGAGGLDIGSGVILSPNVVIATTAHARANGRVSLRQSQQAPVSLGVGSWVASNSVVTKGANVGAGVIVGAGSVVVGNLEDNGFYAGAPARLIRWLDEAEAA